MKAKKSRVGGGGVVKVGGDCVVITTLARAREHPFSTDGWDLVVIDECLSVMIILFYLNFALFFYFFL